MFDTFFPFLLSLIGIMQEHSHFVFDFLDANLSLLKFLFVGFLELIERLPMAVFDRFELPTEIIVTLMKFLFGLSEKKNRTIEGFERERERVVRNYF